MPKINAQEWTSFLDGFPDAHLLQTATWGELKASFGWKSLYVVSGLERHLSGAQILFHPLPLGFSLAYIPKGPLGPCEDPTQPLAWPTLWREIDSVCKKNKAIFLKVEPDLWEPPGGRSAPGEKKKIQPPPGFRLSIQSIQPVRTLLVDLRGDEEEVLGRMKQKTRYNIRLALKKGVIIHPSADLEAFYRLVAITGERDRFGVHNLEYYRRAYELFYPRGACELLMAEFQGEPLAGLMTFAHGKRAWFLYGGSASNHRDRMPNYLLQWESMRWARARGCEQYDLWGVPDEDEATLEAMFPSRSDGLWGVYRFKRGYGGELCRAVGPWDRVYNPVLYAFYLWWVKRSRISI